MRPFPCAQSRHLDASSENPASVKRCQVCDLAASSRRQIVLQTCEWQPARSACSCCLALVWQPPSKQPVGGASRSKSSAGQEGWRPSVVVQTRSGSVSYGESQVYVWDPKQQKFVPEAEAAASGAAVQPDYNQEEMTFVSDEEKIPAYDPPDPVRLPHPPLSKSYVPVHARSSPQPMHCKHWRLISLQGQCSCLTAMLSSPALLVHANHQS